MTELSYDTAPLPIRRDLSAAHRRAWRHISMPGSPRYFEMIEETPEF